MQRYMGSFLPQTHLCKENMRNIFTNSISHADNRYSNLSFPKINVILTKIIFHAAFLISLDTFKVLAKCLVYIPFLSPVITWLLCQQIQVTYADPFLLSFDVLVAPVMILRLIHPHSSRSQVFCIL